MNHRINYNGHSGTLFTNTNRVMFYGTTFETMCHAVRLLKKLPVGIKYSSVCRVGVRGFKLHGGQIVIDTGQDTILFARESEFEEFYLKNYNVYLS
tara:strand:+ start:2345 stop:2632 length:288 start_codon:yes stop_codon:yes gene_type:complete